MWSNSSLKLLILIICLGLSLRLGFIIKSDHIHHPDEIFQSLEPAYRLVMGYGLIPWDYVYGLRSYLTPLALSLPLRWLLPLGLGPTGYPVAMGLILTLFSLGVIPAGYILVNSFSRNRRLAITAAFTLAVWYELIYFSPRALSEVFALNLFAWSLVSFKGKPPFWTGLSAFLAALATLLRPQYFPLAIGLLITVWPQALKRPRLRFPLVLGVLTALSLYGYIDLTTLGYPFASIINNIRLSFLAGISAQFGISPWYYYLQTLFIGSGALILLSLPALKYKSCSVLSFTALGLLLIHSLIPHKEYRFSLALIPLTLCLGILALSRTKIPLKAYLIMVCLISALGIFTRLPSQYRLYRLPLLARDSLFSLWPGLPYGQSSCGLYLSDRGWVTSGGYYRLNQNLPLYTLDYPPPASGAANLAVVPSNQLLPKALTLLASAPPFPYLSAQGKLDHPGYRLVASLHPCTPDPEFSYYRSFNYLFPYLTAAAVYDFPQN